MKNPELSSGLGKKKKGEKQTVDRNGNNGPNKLGGFV
jgi:hypothetical protein